MIDETTLTTTLRSLAGDAEIGPEPAAAARRRAHRIHRRRIAGAVTGVVALVAVAAGVPLAVSGGHGAMRSTKPVFVPAERPTSEVVTVHSARSGPYTIRSVVYWHGGELCQALVGAVGVAPSQCSSSTPFRHGLGRPFGDRMIAGIIRSPRIATVGVRYDDGVTAAAQVLSGSGFPHRAYAELLRGGHFVVEVVGYDARGRRVGGIGMDHATPAYLPQAAPGSAVVPVGPQIPATADHGVEQVVAYWHGWNLCAALLVLPESVRGYGCVTGAPGVSALAPGAVTTCTGPDGFVTCGVTDLVARLVLTEADDSRAVGRRVEGYGFPRPVFAFAAVNTSVAWLDAYDAGGHHIARARLTPADLR